MTAYRTIVIDPPWEYERTVALGSNRAAASNYTTMPNAEIAGLPVGDLQW
jgi:N6-adenosine-specific RNA methylase IME4